MAERTEAPLDRTARDGMAGRGDMLGGMNAGAGDRLGTGESADGASHGRDPAHAGNHDGDTTLGYPAADRPSVEGA